jgi:hypothetical protein
MRIKSVRLFCFTGIFLLGFIILTGCSGKNGILEEVSGQWQDSQGKGTIEINLVGESKSIKVDGQAYAVSVDKIEMDRYQVNLKVQNGGDQPELWTLREIWNDVGSSFKLAFEHGGKNRTLIPKG